MNDKCKELMKECVKDAREVMGGYGELNDESVARMAIMLYKQRAKAGWNVS